MENKLQKIEMTLIHRNFVLRISIEQFFFFTFVKTLAFPESIQYETNPLKKNLFLFFFI